MGSGGFLKKNYKSENLKKKLQVRKSVKNFLSPKIVNFFLSSEIQSSAGETAGVTWTPLMVGSFRLWAVDLKKNYKSENLKKNSKSEKCQNFSKSEKCEIFSKFGNSIKRGVNGGSKNDSLKVGQL